MFFYSIVHIHCFKTWSVYIIFTCILMIYYIIYTLYFHNDQIVKITIWNLVVMYLILLHHLYAFFHPLHALSPCYLSRLAFIPFLSLLTLPYPLSLSTSPSLSPVPLSLPSPSAFNFSLPSISFLLLPSLTTFLLSLP